MLGFESANTFFMIKLDVHKRLEMMKKVTSAAKDGYSCIYNTTNAK
jgi:hypothetical protein